MKTKHINFEDIEKCVYMRDITPDNMKLLHKVQSHILKCRECRDVYDKLLRVKQVQDDIVVDNTLEEYASEKYEVNKTGGMRVATRIVVSIEKGIRLTLDGIDNFLNSFEYNFEHPIALATRTSEIQKNEMALVDEENDYNKIILDTEGLKITLDADEWNGRKPVLEAKTLDGKSCSVNMLRRNDRYEVLIPIDVSGRYEISIGNMEE